MRDHPIPTISSAGARSMGFRTYKGPDGFHDDRDHEDMKDTLLEAEAIKKDPKVMANIHGKLAETKKSINSIAALRKASEMAEDDTDEGLAMKREDGNDPALKTKVKKQREESDRTKQPG